MGLQLDEAVDHLHAGALEVARPADVGFLVEARLELDQRGDRLAGFRRLGQRLDDRRVGRGAVERLLDRDDVRIARRLIEELHHHVEGFVRVMDDQVLLADRREAVAALIADALGKARIVGHEFQVRPVDRDELRQLVERQHAVDQEHLVVRDAERALHEGAQLRRHRGIDLEPDHRAAAAALQRGLEQPHQILGLFLDFDVGVADDAEAALPLHGVAGEQPADEQAGRLLQRDEALAAALRVRQADEAVERARHADQRVHAAPVARARELQRDGEAEIGNERERMRRIDRERRQHRKDVLQEMILEPGLLGLGDVGAVDQDDVFLAQVLAQRAPARLLVGREAADRLADAHELFGRASARPGSSRRCPRAPGPSGRRRAP